MKVYVCFFDTGFHGCSGPEKVFSDKSKAIEWVAENNTIDLKALYKEMDVE